MGLLRLHLIRAARDYIDLQNFILRKDATGELFLNELLGAARRGVKVRLLLDQMFSFSDAEYLVLLTMTHENLEVRFYNPSFDKAKMAKHDWLTGMRGGEWVLYEIAKLFPEAPVYTLVHRQGSVMPALEEHPIRLSWLQRPSFGGRKWRYLLPLMPAAMESFTFPDADLVISTSHCVAFSLASSTSSRGFTGRGGPWRSTCAGPLRAAGRSGS